VLLPNDRALRVLGGLCALTLALAPSAGAQDRGVSIVGGLGIVMTPGGDPEFSNGGLRYCGSILFPVTRTLRIAVDAQTPAGIAERGQSFFGAALLVEGPTGRRVRLVAGGGISGVRGYHNPSDGYPTRGLVPALYGELGTIINAGHRVPVRVDGIFWAGRGTQAASMRFGAAYRF
jgi:hypothetical protein